jgi:predicted Ser/Thr protein kinase
MTAPCPRCGTPTESTGASATCARCGASFATGELATTPDATPVDPFVGTILGGCRLLERIGAGGMGIVYKAEQISLGRVVAVKLLPETHRNDPQIVERFRREIQILARLSHPAIVSILDGGSTDRGLYFVMEYVDGVSLRRILNTEGLDPSHALTIVRQLCDALDYAHVHGVIHRDIKPENILIDRKGHVRLLDFGLSRYTSAGEPGVLTRPTQGLGTFESTAPEQREAARDVDHRADLYSLGVVIYEMLTGELPIGKFDPPSKKNIQVDVRLDDVVLRVLEKSPDRRYQKAAEIRTEVDRIASTPSSHEPTPPVVPPAAEPRPPVAVPRPPSEPPAATPVVSGGGGDRAARTVLWANLSIILAGILLLLAIPTIAIPASFYSSHRREGLALLTGLIYCTLACTVTGLSLYTAIRAMRQQDSDAGLKRSIAAVVVSLGSIFIIIPWLVYIVVA